jgi:predicted dinucleotide-binding enzyme
MQIAMIGGGAVGQALGAGLIRLGHQVVIGIRSPSEAELAKPRSQAKPLAEWSAATGGRVASMAEAAAGAEVVFNTSNGAGSLAALHLAGAENLAGKLLVDVANPLDFSQGFPPFLIREFSGPTSLGEQIQAAFPRARVVKAFNTVANAVMVDPALAGGPHDLFLAGNDAAAKAEVQEIARGFGWQTFVDLGDITGARASEAILPLWVRLFVTGGSPAFNLHVQRG